MPGQQPIEDSNPRVRVEVVDHLPQGRLVARFETAHETVILVAKDAFLDFPAFLCQLEAVLNEGVESDLWQRHLVPHLQLSGE